MNYNTTIYLVDDRNPSGYAQVMEEYTNTGENSQVTLLSRSYNYGLNLISQQQFDPVTLLPSVLSYYGYDGHGNVRFLMDTNGAVTDTYTYDAFGNIIASTGSTPNNYLYCGQQWDPDLGVYYNRARYMNTDAGRFLSPDSTDGDQEDPLSLHKYLYAQDNPANVDDPSGNDGESIAEVSVATEISVGLSAFATAGITYLAYRADQRLAYSSETRAINQFVAGHSTGGLNQDDFDKLVKTARWPQPSRPLYLHYSQSANSSSLLQGLRPSSWATRTVYYTGWQAKASLALPHSNPPNAAYIVRPKQTFEPAGPNPVAGMLDVEGRWMPGGGQEWKFVNGSGGPGSVFGPIPIPQGKSPLN
jgi:RHS repeat-associated protein